MMGENVSMCTNGQNFHPALMAFQQVAWISPFTRAGDIPCSDMMHAVYALFRNRLHAVWSANTFKGVVHHSSLNDKFCSVHKSQ